MYIETDERKVNSRWFAVLRMFVQILVERLEEEHRDRLAREVMGRCGQDGGWWRAWMWIVDGCWPGEV